MMKRTMIKEIKERDQVAGLYLVARKDMGLSKTGKAYVNLRLMDSTGSVEARIWDNADALAALFQKDDVVSIKGYAVAYQGGIQLNVNSISAAPEGSYSVREFLPASTRAPEEMMADLDAVIAGVGNPQIRALLEAIFTDADVRARFQTAPAAKVMHHPYLGGLLEHVLSICGLASKVGSHYGKGVDVDLLICGAILHDIGKIYELTYSKSFDYTDEGRLLGHITLGIALIDDKVKGIEKFDPALLVLIKHMILSHHGHLEFGSPKRPKTTEALILYYLDDLDAKVNAIESLKRDAHEAENRWTGYQRIFERYMYLGAREEALDAAVPSVEDVSPRKDTLPLFKQPSETKA
ncbi:MAG: HD domain-containing protein [Deltaproteobacteria bacterium]|nr:HD domain-containing protein [Deltaproteobacteria bacterium]